MKTVHLIIINMKRILLFAAALVLMTGCSDGEKVIDYPAADFYTTPTLDIRRIELTDTSTVLHFSAVYIPWYWIRLDTGTHITARGVKLPCRRSDRLVLGEKFHIPESGRDTFSLTFPPVPRGTKTIDFSEERSGDAFRILGIDLTGKRTPLDICRMVPAFARMTPDREAGLPAPMMTDGTTTVNVNLLGYHAFGGNDVHIYVSHLDSGQEERDLAVDARNAMASGTFSLHGPAKMVITRPVYVDFMAAPGETVDVYVDLTARSSEIRKKHFPEVVGSIEPRPRAYFRGTYSALNWYLNNEDCDDLPSDPFIMGVGIDSGWSDEEYADNVIRCYRVFADSLAAMPAAASVKEYYAGGLKNALISAFRDAAELRRESYVEAHGYDAPVPDFKNLSPDVLARLKEVVDVRDSSLLAYPGAISEIGRAHV